MTAQRTGTLATILERQLDPPETTILLRVLAALDHEVRSALGSCVAGVYLEGSFALGSGDVHSDVDFLVATHHQLALNQQQQLREIHRVFPDRPEHWARVLEGSYATVEALGGRADGTPWLYVDNGQPEMEFSAHDNTEVLRWVLKHHGVMISGAAADSLISQVPAKALRDEAACLALSRRDSALGDPDYLANAWGQPHEVLTSCRMLYTAATAQVSGKHDSARWCLGVVPSEWHPLIQAAILSRPDPWHRVHQRADPELAALTAAFIDFMSARIVDAAGQPPSTRA